MRGALIVAALVLPSAVSAREACRLRTFCTDHDFGELTVRMPAFLDPAGDVCDLSCPQGMVVLVEGAPPDPGGVITLYEPCANGRTSLLALFPDVKTIPSPQQLVDGTPQGTTIYGDCTSEGG